MSTISVNSSAGLLSALASAHSGDVIQLAAGSYAGVTIKNINIAGNVTITSASASNQAVFSGLDVTSSSGLTFTNLTVDGSKASDSWASRVYTSQNIVFNNVNYHGSMDGNPGDDNAAMLIEWSQNVTVTNSQFQQFSNAIGDLNNTGVTFSNNSFHDIQSDGIDNGGSSNVTISGNTFTNFFPGTSGQHPDAIPVLDDEHNRFGVNITVTNNTITAGSGGQIQGIFIKDESNGLLPYQNVTVTGNTVTGGLWNGIAVSNASNVTVANNVVTGNPNATGALNGIGQAAATNSWILLGNVSTVNLSGNTSTGYLISGVTGLTQSATNVLNGVQQTATMSSAVSTTLSLLSNALQLTGTASITGTANATGSTIYANNAGDRLNDGAGNDTLIGGTGNDTLYSSAGNDTLTGGLGSDAFVIGTGVGHTVITDFGTGGVGDALNLSAFINAGLKPILTNVGGNVVVSFAGSSATITLTGVQASQLLATSTGYISNFTAPVYTSTNNATLDQYHHTMVLQGSSYLSVKANATGSTIFANNAGDRIFDGAGNDTLIGGTGNDTLYSTAGNDTLTGGLGNDSFLIGAGIGHTVITDFGTGGVGDSLDLSAFLSAGKTPILTNAGSDLVISFAGSSATITLKGVQASQLLATATGYISNFTAPVYTSANNTTLDQYHHTMVLQGSSYMSVTANATGSTIYANNAGDRIFDGAGNDTFIGGTGNDTLYSTAGNDTLTGGGGNNTFMIGTGAGHDVITDFGSGGGDALNLSAFLSAGKTPILTNVGSDLLISFSGSSATVTLKGVQASQLLATSTGYISNFTAPVYTSANNTTLDQYHHTMVLQGSSYMSVTANATGSTIYANNAGDRIFDGAGNDTLIGGTGNDTLVSSSGNDTLTGGGGNDAFTIGTGIGHDIITDFGNGHDTLTLTSYLNAGMAPILTNVGANTVISFTGGAETITLMGVHSTDLVSTSYGFSHI